MTCSHQRNTLERLSLSSYSKIRELLEELLLPLLQCLLVFLSVQLLLNSSIDRITDLFIGLFLIVLPEVYYFIRLNIAILKRFDHNMLCLLKLRILVPFQDSQLKRFNRFALHDLSLKRIHQSQANEED